MLDQSDILLISYPPIIIGILGLIFCFTRDLLNIKNNKGREQNTAPEIYWFMQVLIIVGLFLGFDWKWALLIVISEIVILHPLRKRTKLIQPFDENAP